MLLLLLPLKHPMSLIFQFLVLRLIFLKKTNFGWSYQVWASSFEVDHQKIDGDFKDIGTSVSGTYFYALPLLYYRFGDRFSSKPVRNWRVTASLGYGISYTSMSGDLVKTTKSTEVADTDLYKVDVSGFYYSFGMSLKASYKKVFFAISTSSPQVKDSDNDLIYRIHNVSYTLGYEFALDFELNDII